MTWKLNKIKERYLCITMDSDGRNVFGKKMVIKTINNPSVNDIWFFHIKNKNIVALQEMLDVGVIKIDVQDKVQGDTIVHESIQRRNLKLLDFCIKNKADFNMKASVDGETALFESSYGYVGIRVFRIVWQQLNVKNLYKTLMEKSDNGKRLYENLCGDDRNIHKLEWLSRVYLEDWNKFKLLNLEKMINCAAKEGANKNLFFIKGLQNIKNKLQKNLLQTNKLNKKIKI